LGNRPQTVTLSEGMSSRFIIPLWRHAVCSEVSAQHGAVMTSRSL